MQKNQWKISALYLFLGLLIGFLVKIPLQFTSLLESGTLGGVLIELVVPPIGAAYWITKRYASVHPVKVSVISTLYLVAVIILLRIGSMMYYGGDMSANHFYVIGIVLAAHGILSLIFLSIFNRTRMRHTA